LEQDEKSVRIKETSWNFPVAVIIGNEAKGIDKEILQQCDLIVEIPMRGHKESLNVSVATGIAVYEILK
jgi:23S rRNA (guanosine2251-2'-O)-methyltransferase